MKRNFPLFRIKESIGNPLIIMPFEGRKWITNACAIIDYDYVNKSHAKAETLKADDHKSECLKYLIQSFYNITNYMNQVKEDSRKTEREFDFDYLRIYFTIGDTFVRINGDLYAWFADMAKIDGYALFANDKFSPIFLVNMHVQKVVGAVMPLHMGN